MKLVRFKCNECKRDFYANSLDIQELMDKQEKYSELDIFCPFCDDGIGIEIGIVTFDDRSVLDSELITVLVTKSRKVIDQMEEITYKLENMRVKPNTEKVNE